MRNVLVVSLDSLLPKIRLSRSDTRVKVVESSWLRHLESGFKSTLKVMKSQENAVLNMKSTRTDGRNKC